jgi:rubredoxin
MEFPITDLLSHEESTQWILEHFHPPGLKCPDCGAPDEQARPFRRIRKSRLMVYRCRVCDRIYNLYTVCKGEPSATLVAELEVSYSAVLDLRRWLSPSRS